MSGKNESWVPIIDDWLHDFCDTAPCSNSTVQAVFTNITTGCETDLNTLGVNQTALNVIGEQITTWFTLVRRIGCLAE